MNLHGTTILCIRDQNSAIMIGDGQVTLGNSAIKNTAQKLVKATSYSGECIIGIAGATSIGIKMRNMLVKILENTTLSRACEKVAKQFNPGEPLHGGQAMLIVTNIDQIFILTGQGDILIPEDNAFAIGSGGNEARAATLASLNVCKTYNLIPDISSIARISMRYVAEICIYTNSNFQEILITKNSSLKN